jgi:hypothetical protein
VRYLLLVTFLLGWGASPGQAQSPDTESEVDFVREQEQLSPAEQQTREQLRNVLSEYDVSPWLRKREVRVDSSSVGGSGPDFITLSTDHLGDDLGLLSEFIHEQIHRITFEERRERRNAAIREFQSLYPNAPSELPEGGPGEFATYMHLVINWLELDAMTELVEKKTARRLAADEEHYTWINRRVLEDTEKIGAVLAKHDLLITPEKG